MIVLKLGMKKNTKRQNNVAHVFIENKRPKKDLTLPGGIDEVLRGGSIWRLLTTLTGGEGPHRRALHAEQGGKGTQRDMMGCRLLRSRVTASWFV